ncbi:MAG: beta-lactamase family protein, partial [Candidatus Bathyarchaeota archaeon]
NFGYTILGQIIETVSGQRYPEFIQQRILSPLGMDNTVVDVDETNVAKHATGYKPRVPKQERKPFDHIPANIMSSATGLSSTVEDLIKFYQAHMFGNDRLLPDYVKREMQRPHFERPVSGAANASTRGLGFAIDKIGAYTLVGHGGGYNGFVTDSRLIPDQKIVIVVLCNPGPANTFLKGIVNLFDKLEKNEKDFLVKDPQQRPDFSSIIGFYADADEWEIVLYSQIGSKLVSIQPDSENPMDFFRSFEHDRDFKFIETKESPIYAGESFEFVDDPEGEKILIESHQGKMFPYQFEY